MDKLLKGVRTVLYGFSVVAMSVMLIVIFAQVVTRYFLGKTDKERADIEPPVRENPNIGLLTEPGG